MIMLILIGLIAVLGLIIVALLYRSKAKQAEHYAAIQSTVAEAARHQVEHRQKLDDQLNTLHERQRNETITETAHLAERNDFNDDWLGGVSGGSAAGSHANDGVTAADASGAADHTE